MDNIIPDKFFITENSTIEDVYSFLNKSLSLNNWYVHVFHLDKKLDDIEWMTIAKLLNLKIMKYNDLNYVDYNEIFLENEFHFDGITSPNFSRVPKVLGFQSLKNHTQVGGEIKLLNCEEILKKINMDVYKILKTSIVNYYGMKGFFNKHPKFDELVFDINPIKNQDNLEFLRIHLPTKDKNMRKITNLGIYSKVDDYTSCLYNQSAKQSVDIFDHISEVAMQKDVTLKFKMSTNMLVLVNNNAVFHGREKVSFPENRLLRRVQFI